MITGLKPSLQETIAVPGCFSVSIQSSKYQPLDPLAKAKTY